MIFNLILIFSFSVSVNTYSNIELINLSFYIFFHLAFIYTLFYHYHYSIFILCLLYGILYDIFLINEIGTHLLSLLILTIIYIFFKKYFFLFSSYKISITLFITLLTVLIFEILLAHILNNINFSISKIIKYFIISTIIFFPSILMFNKIDR